jgi:hypothetical protein
MKNSTSQGLRITCRINMVLSMVLMFTMFPFFQPPKVLANCTIVGQFPQNTDFQVSAAREAIGHRGVISDVVWNDFNSNGSQEADELGIKNVTIDLYKDNNKNSTIDGGDTFLETKITKSNGFYTFGGLVAGDYLVTVSDANRELSGYYLVNGTELHNVSLETDQDTGTANFGYLREPAEMEFGDALGSNYPTLRADNGARHLFNPTVFLGPTIDSEVDGQPNPNGHGDNMDGNNDKDGITFTSPLVQSYDNNIKVEASTDGYLNAWMDLNQDGDWADVGEHVFVDESLSPGTNNLMLRLPQITDLGENRDKGFVSRFRFSSERGLCYNGLALDGEVEDYIIDVVAPTELANFSSIVNNGLVTLQWESRSETDDLGFNIYRKEGSAAFVKVNTSLIPCTGPVESVNHYSFADKNVETGKAYTYRLEDMSNNGLVNSHKTIMVNVEKPDEYSLDQNYPNPFNPEKSITFSIKKAGHVELKIFNMNGKLVHTLVDGIMVAGTYTKTWEGKDVSKKNVPGGTYIYTILIDGFKQSKQMTLLK